MICYSEKLILQKYNILRSHLLNVGSNANSSRTYATPNFRVPASLDIDQS
ncbi:hypothetical protein RintRC_7611 [Richelia intracellularis]|nr:hypothetical protein RintRC_7611 [Richelia intracellularis]